MSVASLTRFFGCSRTGILKVCHPYTRSLTSTLETIQRLSPVKSSTLLNQYVRGFSTRSLKPKRHEPLSTTSEEASDSKPLSQHSQPPRESIRKNFNGKPYQAVDLATSVDYLNSDVYRNTYRGKPVWFFYRRNFKGHYPPPLTRPNCVVNKKLISSNPCPICRDEYLVLDYRHTELLRQFVNPISGAVFDPSTTGLCQHQHSLLLLEIEKARDIGTIEMWLPFVLYNYSDYYDASRLDDHLLLQGQSLANQTALSESFVQLPSDIQRMLVQTNGVLPHAAEVVPEPAKTEIERPKVPNRYRMEEAYKALLLKRRRSKTILLS